MFEDIIQDKKEKKEYLDGEEMIMEDFRKQAERQYSDAIKNYKKMKNEYKFGSNGKPYREKKVFRITE